MKTDAMTDVELLQAAIKKSGLSARQYAMQRLTRNERTIRRWLTGQTPIPKVVIPFLKEELLTQAEIQFEDVPVGSK